MSVSFFRVMYRVICCIYKSIGSKLALDTCIKDDSL